MTNQGRQRGFYSNYNISMPAKPKSDHKFLVVTTVHKGVFAGYGVPTDGKTIRLEQAQMCVYWSSVTHGVLGLAAQGPGRECKIGPPVPAITLQDVTSVTEASPEAESKWRAQPWS